MVSISDLISSINNLGERFLALLPDTFVVQKVHLKGNPFVVIIVVNYLSLPMSLFYIYLS